jgi:TorA maturation chaperone TorD
MSSNSDRDIARVRLRFIDLVKSFFLEEPEAEKFSRWRGIFSALSSEPVNKDLDQAVSRIVEMLDSVGLQDVQDEYYSLFDDPFSEHRVSLSASFYIDGKSHGQTLAEFRGFLAEANIEKAEFVREAEDTLPVMVDCLASLIELEKEDEPRARRLQVVLVKQYLVPLATQLSQAFKKNDKAVFYEACGQFLLGYAELDQALFEAV